MSIWVNKLCPMTLFSIALASKVIVAQSGQYVLQLPQFPSPGTVQTRIFFFPSFYSNYSKYYPLAFGLFYIKAV